MKKAVRILVYTAFIIYCLALVKFILLDGRFQNEDTVVFYFSHSNLIPFKMFYDYAQRLQADSINLEIVIRNLLGNLIVLFPMGCFLPCLWTLFRKFCNLFLLCLGIVCIVELSEPLLRIGFLDIDDFILNLSGASLGFGIVHIPLVNRLLRKLHIYGE